MGDPETTVLQGKVFERMISAAEINEKVVSLARQIKSDVGDEVPLFLCILKGSFVFASDLMRAYDGLCEVEFVRLTSYQGTHSTGSVKTMLGMDFSKLNGRRVVVVEDIIDTGLTMQSLLGELQNHAPKTLNVATLFVKPEKLRCDIDIKYSCFDIPDAFIVGYGLDCDEKYRNLPAIYVLKEQEN